MSDLGLGALTDDQLVEMARALSEEISARDAAVQAAATDAIRAEADRAASLYDWSRKRTIAVMVLETLGAGWHVAVLRGEADTETRVLLEGPPPPRRGVQGRVIYHATGSDQYAPGTLQVWGAAGAGAGQPMLAAICDYAASLVVAPRFAADILIDRDDIEPAPLPSDYVRLTRLKKRRERRKWARTSPTRLQR